MFVTSASRGQRLTCTLKMDRKMLIRTALPNSGSSTSSMCVTVPSAGLTSTSGSAEITRCGSRKNVMISSSTNDKAAKGIQNAQCSCIAPATQPPARTRYASVMRNISAKPWRAKPRRLR